MNDPRRYDELQKNEWECVCCHSYNIEEDEYCWNCNADQDGEGGYEDE
jgi:hypothetical protein